MTPAEAPSEALAGPRPLLAGETLGDGEIILLLARPSARLIPAFAVMPVAILLFAACAVWAAGLAGAISAEKVDGMLLALGCVAVLVVAVQLYRWRCRRYILTNARVLCRTGLLYTRTQQAGLAELLSVEVIRFPPEQLMGLGTVCFRDKAGGFRSDLVWGNLSHPEEIADEIRKAMRFSPPRAGERM